MIELIIKKRDGLELSKEEYATIINGFISGKIPDYQVSAFLMAVVLNGMSVDETVNLTDIMMRSGELIDLSEIEGVKVDKHSTGGVGDKTSLVLAPLVAAAGIPVPKMSGRGLGFTGGTLDKLESIKGFSVDVTPKEFNEQLKRHNIVICGQNENLVPADKALYALRDVTGTVENISLIASSIMSKKLACGADVIVIDMKVGYGASMKTIEEAESLANMMIEIGSKMNKKVVIVFSSMNQPLGFNIGNALEIKEVIDTLRGQGPDDLTQLCFELGSHMLVLGKVAKTHSEAVKILKQLISSGAAFLKFKEFVKAQGGDLKVIDHPDLLPSVQFSEPYLSSHEGYITELNAKDVGLASVKLGAGRETKKSVINYGAGIILKKKIGDKVTKGELLANLYSDDPSSFSKAKQYMDLAYKFSKQKPQEKALIFKTMQ